MVSEPENMERAIKYIFKSCLDGDHICNKKYADANNMFVCICPCHTVKY